MCGSLCRFARQMTHPNNLGTRGSQGITQAEQAACTSKLQMTSLYLCCWEVGERSYRSVGTIAGMAPCALRHISDLQTMPAERWPGASQIST